MSIAPCLVSSMSNEWYTPRQYIEAARAVMGSIDVDPASDEFANRIVKATVFYTPETNGFSKRWTGNVWLNPPYGRGDSHKANQSLWTQRLIEQYQAGITKQAVLLVNSKTGDRWFQPLWQFPICFPNHRIDFYTVTGVSTASPMSSVLVYMGPKVEKFRQVFQQFGRVVLPDKEMRVSLWTPVEEKVCICGADLAVHTGGGRQKRYCSDRCRQQAKRDRDSLKRDGQTEKGVA